MSNFLGRAIPYDEAEEDVEELYSKLLQVYTPQDSFYSVHTGEFFRLPYQVIG